MYAIVRAGGRQEKVAVGDVLTIDRVEGEPGSTLQLRALLLVDDGQVTSDAAVLAGVTVTAEVVAATKGPKIVILKFKNKTGYRKRQGHRAKLTQVRVTGIENAAGGTAGPSESATDSSATDSSETDSSATDSSATDSSATDSSATQSAE